MADISRLLGRLFAAAGQRSAAQRYAFAMISPLAALALTILIINTTEDPFFTFFTLAVVLASIFGGTKPGLVATAIGALLNYFAAPPALSFRVADSQDLVRIAAFALVGSAIAILIGTTGRLQQRLDIERRHLEVTIKSIGDAVIATDVHGRITFMNAAAEKATGWTQIHATGHPLHEVFRIIDEQTRATRESPVEKVLRSGQVVGLANHTLLVRKDGTEIPIDDSAAPILNAGMLAGVVLVFRDVTEARLSQAALLQAEKLASVGRLAATIAHEINNPLEAVGNLLYLIRASQELAAAKTFAESAEHELARAAHVSRQTLSFARQTGNAEEVAIAELVDSLVLLYRDKLESRGVSVTKRYRGEGVVLGVRNDLGQVISNLLSNAIDAERPGGRIDIRVFENQARHTVRLTVADRGCGIGAEHRERIFQPFFTTKADVGTGLGLWLTKSIVDASGARIRLRSRPGRGTVFCITWRAASAPELQKHAGAWSSEVRGIA